MTCILDQVFCAQKTKYANRRNYLRNQLPHAGAHSDAKINYHMRERIVTLPEYWTAIKSGVTQNLTMENTTREQ